MFNASSVKHPGLILSQLSLQRFRNVEILQICHTQELVFGHRGQDYPFLLQSQHGTYQLLQKATKTMDPSLKQYQSAVTTVHHGIEYKKQICFLISLRMLLPCTTSVHDSVSTMCSKTVLGKQSFLILVFSVLA